MQATRQLPGRRDANVDDAWEPGTEQDKQQHNAQPSMDLGLLSCSHSSTSGNVLVILAATGRSVDR